MNECDIFMAALERDSLPEREAFLDEACCGNTALRQRVESLLNSHVEAGSLLEHPVFTTAATVLPAESDVTTDGAAGPDRDRPATADHVSLDFLAPADGPESLGSIGPYAVTAVVGRGGMGVVVKARDAKLNRVVAIKVMAPELAANPTARKRFIREAQAAAAVVHQHVVTIHAVDEDRLPYLVMEYIDGQSLQEKIDRQGHLELREILRIGQQVAAGLAAAHAHGLMHRDVKPANILLENGVERVRITDFGLARAVDDVGMTRTGDVAGTPQYMSPEQAQGLPLDAKSDLFSLGCVLYAMCTGRSPFRAETTVAVMRRVCDDAPRPMREVNPEIPQWLVEIIDRLLAKKPAERFQTAAEVADLLGQRLAQLQHPTASAMVAMPRPKSAIRNRGTHASGSSAITARPWAIAAAAAVLLLVGISLTEATGVTHVVPTVIRIVTGEGTLIVETDSDVQVTLAGNGDLIFHLAGGQSIRVPTGDYRVKATKDGQPVPVEKELVSIARGGREVVKVKLEAPPATAAQVPAPIHEVWKRPRGGVVDIALSPDGKQGAGCMGHNVFLFDPATGQELKRFEGHEDDVRSVVFSPDGLRLASGGHDATVRIWDLKDGREIKQFATERVVDGGTGRPFSDLAFSPDGTRLLAGSRNDLLMWNLESGELVRRFVGHTGAPRRVVFSPDGERIASCGHDGTARLWRTQTGELLHTLREESSWIVTVQFSPDGTLLATGGRQVTLWDVESGRQRWHYPIGDRWAEGLTITPDGRFVLAAIGDFKAIEGELVVLEMRSGHAVHRAGGLSPYIFALTTSAGGRDVFLGESKWMRLGRLPESLWKAVHLKSDALATAKAATTPGIQPFVVLGTGGVEVRKFDTLAEAVQGASDGDTIEIRGNGPFVSEPVKLTHALTIRAGDGYRPVLQFGDNLQTNAPLVLEGLELQRVGQKVPQGSEEALVLAWGSRSLHLLNCRFREHLRLPCVRSNAPHCVLRNCEFLSPMQQAAHLDGKQCVIDNCLVAGRGLLVLGFRVRPDEPDVSVQLTRSTLRSPQDPLLVNLVPVQPDKLSEKDARRVRFDASGTIFDANSVVVMNEVLPFLAHLKPKPQDAKELLLRMLSWRDRGNLYAPGGSVLLWNQPPEGVAREIGPRSLADWKRLWASGDEDAVEGRVRYQGGDLLARLSAAPEKLTPEDFRLRPDSPGYRAGKDGKDLGADVDLVGPGQAYERWKTTPEYQHWLKDTGQLKERGTDKPETGAFVVQGGKGVAERTFDTLAEAVQRASDGDTIEIRGNGPFITQPIKITNALSIRAAAGFRPVIQRDATESPAGAAPSAAAAWADAFIEAAAPLVLEGLELRWLNERERGQVWNHLLIASNALHATNCKFVTRRVRAQITPMAGFYPVELRNCEFLAPSFFNDAPVPTKAVFQQAQTKVLLDNCLLTGGLFFSRRWGYQNGAELRLTHCTLRTASEAIQFNVLPGVGGEEDFASEDWTAKAVQAEASSNLIASDAILAFAQQGLKAPLPPGEAENLLARIVGWRGRRNVYACGSALVKLKRASPDALLPPPLIPSGLAGWKQLWQTAEEGSIEGSVRFVGGDLLAKADSALERIVPDDFRLRADSAGYRAGPDGRDLGADVDLVGPGAAYERWKKTPEYQQWLQDTAQRKKTADAKPEAGAFVLQGGGLAERKFDTLAAAVQRASDGDTIEIRGNGPFVTEPIKISGSGLIIRAAEGYRPVIRLSDQGVQFYDPLLETKAALTLEGLEFQRLGQKAWKPGQSQPCIIFARGASLGVANCRFRSDAGATNLQVHIVTNAPVSQIRNCLFLTPGETSVGAWCNTLVLDNCLHLGRLALSTGAWGAGNGGDIRLRRNTLVGPNAHAINLAYFPEANATPRPAEVPNSLKLEATENVFDASHVLHFGPNTEQAPDPKESESSLVRVVTWKGRDNVYQVPAHFVLWTWPRDMQAQSPHGPRSVEDWRKFWNSPEPGSVEGVVRYQGGDLLARLAAAPDKLTPEDFRLRPDSAGYRAGEDGKDLGADVDLVGPGAAYERWKKTPEYQEWLKDTKQLTKTESAIPETDAAARELAKWQGEWENDVYGRLVIDGDRWSSRPKNGFEVVSKIKIVEVTDEMTHILLLSGGADGKVRTIQTILRVDGDTLHNCGTFGSVRPTEFATKAGCIYTQWKRVSRPPP